MPSRAAEGSPATNSKPFADRLAALVEERRSQVCIGLDPDFDAEPWRSASPSVDSADPAVLAASAVEGASERLIEAAGSSCVAVKPQLARFEMLGAPGGEALEKVCRMARSSGLLVVLDGKRGDVPVSARAYAATLAGSTSTPWGDIPGLGADAFTASPLMGGDSMAPLFDAAERAGAGVFTLVRTSNPGAADVLDLRTQDGPVHEQLARLVDRNGERLAGESGLSGAGAVVGATEPRFIARLRELMPRAIFLLPGVGAQGGDPESLGGAFAPGPASALITASRSIAGADRPAEAAEQLRATIWSAATR